MEGTPPVQTDTPDGSIDGSQSRHETKVPAMKDKRCQFCQQAFTSSSLGRHLDQFIFKKKPDGIHDVEEIRRLRSGITRRQARSSSGKRESPDTSTGPATATAYSAAPTLNGKTSHDGQVRTFFNTASWHATGVINDIPSPGMGSQETIRPIAPVTHARTASTTDFTSRQPENANVDTTRALELALREVLDNVKAATTKFQPRMSPFDFDLQTQTFPALCLHTLPPPPSLLSTQPFSSPTSFPLEPPGGGHADIVQQALRAQIAQWKADQLASLSQHHGGNIFANTAGDPDMINRTAVQHEEMTLRHLNLALKHWMSLPEMVRRDSWQLEMTRAYAREAEKRKKVEEQLFRVQQEANQLRAQVERLGTCQWPREFAIFPPDALPLSREAAKELDTTASVNNPTSTRWDYDNVVAKWKRVVMHDKGMGRAGPSYANSMLPDEPDADGKNSSGGVNGNANTNNANRPGSRTLFPPHSSQSVPNSPLTSQSQSSTNPTLQISQAPHQSPESSRSAKRQRLANGRGRSVDEQFEGRNSAEVEGGEAEKHLASMAARVVSNPPPPHNRPSEPRYLKPTQMGADQGGSGDLDTFGNNARTSMIRAGAAMNVDMDIDADADADVDEDGYTQGDGRKGHTSTDIGVGDDTFGHDGSRLLLDRHQGGR